MEFADLVVVMVICGFVALCAAYVRWCDRLVGPDPAATDVRVAAGARPAEAEAQR